MIHDYMSMGTAGVVSIVSMLVVFSVLLLLYVIVLIFGKVVSSRTAKAPAPAAAPAAPQQDDGELLAVLSAAIAAYDKAGNPMIRNRSDLD